MNVELNEQEAGALLRIIDLAVKAGGMQVAEAGVHFSKKIEAAAETERQSKSEGSVAAFTNGAAVPPKKAGKEVGKEAV